uniref:sensor histidine kinase n=1 Tax=Candidatus Electronema sp. TaxID=2698783 RepID=UPI0040577955
MKNPASLCFLVCEYLRPETEAAVRTQNLTEAQVRDFPARCGRPFVDRKELAALLREIKPGFAEIIGSRCLAPNLYLGGSRVRRAEQCAHFLCSPTMVRHLRQSGAGLILPGWLARWHQRLASCGEDRLKVQHELFGEEISRLVLLDTGTDEMAGWHLDELSAFLRLPAEVVPVGLEYHGLLLTKIAAEHRQQELERQKELARQQNAQAAMTFDLLGLVVKANSEPEVLAGIAGLFTMLFAPRRICCIPAGKNGLAAERLELSDEERQAAERFYSDSHRQHQLNKNGDSFFLRIGADEQTAAVVLVEEVAFPQHIRSYLNAALHLSGVCALAVEHVRTLKKLLDTSRMAGKAEVATEVLHNVGNTLNSVSVSAERLGEMARQSSCATLPEIVQLIEEHKDDPAVFFSSDPRGRKLPLYFASLSSQLLKEQAKMVEEAACQLRHVRRAVEIIRTQQDAARGKGLIEQFELASVIEESLEIFEQKIADRKITVERCYAPLPVMRGERHKILQIAGNLISNAAESFDGTGPDGRKIILRLLPVKGRQAALEVEDNGKGISKAVMERLFAFGFTAKEDGHGFGLHNAANLAAEMRGTLTAFSPGEGCGARFRLELPTAAGEGHEKKRRRRQDTDS